MPTVPTMVEAGARRSTRGPAALGVGLGVATLIAYLPGLGRSLDFDSAETVGLFVRQGPPWHAFRDQAVFNNHPMFSFVEQVVRVATGRSDAATMRLLPIVFGAAAVAMLAWFTARRHGLLAGLAAGAVLAANPTFSSLSRSVRGYSLLPLCALAATIVLMEDAAGAGAGAGSWGRLRRRLDVVYIVAAGIGLATHLYMVPVLIGHAAAVVATGRMDDHWRRRFIGVAVVGACAYAAMAGAMIHANAEHSRIFKAGIPWRITTMAMGGGWAAVVLAPLVVVGTVATLRTSRGARVAGVAVGAVLVVLWAGLQSSALEARFFVWLVPAAAYFAGVAVSRVRLGLVSAAAFVVLAVVAVAPGWTREPTGYRQAAALVRQTNAKGGRSCVVDVGVLPMRAYLDTPSEFAPVTDPAQLDRCDLVVVAAWWPSTAAWFDADNAIIAAAERRFSRRLVLAADDPALVLFGRVGGDS